MEDFELKSAIEALLFVSPEPLTVGQILSVLTLPGPKRMPVEASEAKVLEMLERVRQDCDQNGRGIQLAEVAGGYQLMTRPENAHWIRQLDAVSTSTRLSRPALETLAIVTYRQPITTPEIESIRGVDCSGVLKTLLERRLIRIVGRKDAVGKPMLYGTTREFLQYFGLRDLSDLPPLKELEEVARELPDLEAVTQTSTET